MADTLKARDAKDVQAAVQWALAEKKVLEVVGHGTKRGLGRPAQYDATLDLSALSGVTLYEPEELVLSAKAGTSLAEIEAMVQAKGQQLAFEPIDYGPLLGGAPGRATVGGVLAANLSGPRRIKAGAARDHFLGLSAVSGRGEPFKSGGRVVKNVTGYDLCKLIAGSWGTLAVMTEITIKVLPQPETEQTVMLFGLDEADAAKAMSLVMGSSVDASGAAHLPASVAARVAVREARAVTAFRLEGVGPSVAHRIGALEALLAPFGATVAIGAAASRALWAEIRDARPFAAGGPAGDRLVWRISTAPMHGHEVAAAIGRSLEAEHFYDWAGGLVWIALAPDAADAGAAAVRRALAGRGHATLIRAPAALRASAAAFEPQTGALAVLHKRVKESFDPAGVLEPGRMWAGV
jgi:glycolate oxidase FAD binding subunit